MKVVILAGGFGTRISEESHLRPKPMVEIGEKPILWHIMKIYSHFGFNDFIICLGYKGYAIKEYFINYYLHESDVTFDFRDNNKMEIHGNTVEPWKVTLVNTGLETQTGGRVKKIEKYIQSETFMLTYGDGVANVNLKDLLAFHQKNKRIATVTSIQPAGRWGALDISGNESLVRGFEEKPKSPGNWINGGFFVFESEVFDYIPNDSNHLPLEKGPLEKLAGNGQLAAFKHLGFWQAMDTLRDKNYLEDLWKSGSAPWKIW
ncbi:glucose-1-phosphate cytidylyltransferase [Leptospira noguchii]|uniref:Glucose-1-phosphate cytidylyltransferase n=1 Tax=Leptospira noguchii serovar Panama str. CZ214 TaxID=1001595 RepID=T0FKI8_9LEPT|nr:glucose-1-phosphate cytidylyltransferase [Leptospira noguchii]EQA70095.1 glucose-1-phosphate cytidylyltransferase [Leptospira noguchii serovar Panama str. CZ214]